MQALFYEKTYGCLAGVLLGDAMGMPTEMLTPEEIKEYYGTITTFVRAIPEHPSNVLEPGSITDDSLQTLFIINFILKYDQIEMNAFSTEMKKWASQEKILEKHFFGPSTKKAITRLLNNEDPRETGNRNVTNGAAMRIAPIGVINVGNIKQAVYDAIEVTMPTHGGQPSIEGAAAIAAAISNAMNKDSSIESIVNASLSGVKLASKLGLGKKVVSPSVEKRIKMAIKIAKQYKDVFRIARELYDIIGFGMHIAETVPAAIGMFVGSKGNPIKAITAIVNTGGDTDTIASIVGAISGAYRGISAFNMTYIKKIEQINNIDLEKLSKKLVQKIRI